MGFDQQNDGKKLHRVLERVLIVGDAIFDERAKEVRLHIDVVQIGLMVCVCVCGSVDGLMVCVCVCVVMGLDRWIGVS